MDFNHLVQVIKQRSALGYPLTQEEQNILTMAEQATNDLFNEWLSSVY
nr:MAG TPA: 14-3-3 protein eta [Caudoviricetes sp.]